MKSIIYLSLLFSALLMPLILAVPTYRPPPNAKAPPGGSLRDLLPTTTKYKVTKHAYGRKNTKGAAFHANPAILLEEGTVPRVATPPPSSVAPPLTSGRIVVSGTQYWIAGPKQGVPDTAILTDSRYSAKRYRPNFGDEAVRIVVANVFMADVKAARAKHGTDFNGGESMVDNKGEKFGWLITPTTS